MTFLALLMRLTQGNLVTCSRIVPELELYTTNGQSKLASQQSSNKPQTHPLRVSNVAFLRFYPLIHYLLHLSVWHQRKTLIMKFPSNVNQIQFLFK